MQVKNKAIIGRFPIIVHETRSRAWKQWADAAGIRLPRDPNVIRMDSMIAVARAAERGMGAALVPVPLSERWFDSGSLVPLFRQELVADDGYYLVCKQNRADEPNVRKLREWVLQNFEIAG